jgi:S-adenosylmethionine:tRNA ribosyltransferase-isomerase
MLHTDLFDYNLPPEQIAQVPILQRDRSRLMVVNRKTQQVIHTTVHNLPSFLPAATALIRNTVAVFKARLLCETVSGAPAECFLLHPDASSANPNHWWCLLKPGKKLKKEGGFMHSNSFKARVLEQNSAGSYLVAFELFQDSSVQNLAERMGALPLPQYIERKQTDTLKHLDETHYQTVYADLSERTAAAAPTAGLHFTQSLLEELKNQSVSIYNLTLQIGLGTFQPLRSTYVEQHQMHTELYSIPAETQALLTQLNPDCKRLAIGTTTVRAIESYARDALLKIIPSSNRLQATDIFIYPPYTFQKTDLLLTNFHLPKSSLMCMVAAFLTPNALEGIDWIKELYQEAIGQGYRFFSYGDAMLIM